MEDKKYIVEMPVEKDSSDFTRGFITSFRSRWNEETDNLKQNMNKKYRISLSDGNERKNRYGAIKTASGVCRFSSAKEVKYV